jgi:hypothetical protein
MTYERYNKKELMSLLEKKAKELHSARTSLVYWDQRIISDLEIIMDNLKRVKTSVSELGRLVNNRLFKWNLGKEKEVLVMLVLWLEDTISDVMDKVSKRLKERTYRID